MKVCRLAMRPLTRWIVVALLAGAVGCAGKSLRRGGDDGPIDGAISADRDIGTADSSSEFTTDMDVCSSDVDCTQCLWAPAPKDPSQCPGYFNCCGGMAATKKRCEANQAAWTATCPGQSPQVLECPCIAVCEAGWTTVGSCVGGQCTFDCRVPVDAGGGTGGAGGSGGSGGTGGSGGAGGIGGTGGANKFTDNADGTVTDGVTGLMWTMCSAGQSGADCSGSATTYAWQDAVQYCDGLVFAGYDDWRLPKVREIVSIVDYSSWSPAIDSPVFPATPSNHSFFWSSSSDAVSVSGAWYVYFTNGDVSSNDKSDAYYVRCVRGGPLNIGPFDPLVISGDPVVNDAATALMWQGCSAGQGSADCSSGSATTYAWQDAANYCDGLVYAGYDDWRLPDVPDLVSIVDYSSYDPEIDSTAFPATPSDEFWSSSSYAYSVSYAWDVNFSYGVVSSDDKSDTNYVRCIRGGP
jgi:hypothetical protein